MHVVKKSRSKDVLIHWIKSIPPGGCFILIDTLKSQLKEVMNLKSSFVKRILVRLTSITKIIKLCPCISVKKSVWYMFIDMTAQCPHSPVGYKQFWSEGWKKMFCNGYYYIYYSLLTGKLLQKLSFWIKCWLLLTEQ